MTLDTDNLIKSILDSLSRIDYIKPSEIPNIDLYMDQVTTSWTPACSPASAGTTTRS